MSRGPAIWVTAVALALVNVALAAVIVDAIGQRGALPAWLGPVLVVAGVAALIGAVLLWREYLAGLRER